MFLWPTLRSFMVLEVLPSTQQVSSCGVWRMILNCTTWPTSSWTNVPRRKRSTSTEDLLFLHHYNEILLGLMHNSFVYRRFVFRIRFWKLFQTMDCFPGGHERDLDTAAGLQHSSEVRFVFLVPQRIWFLDSLGDIRDFWCRKFVWWWFVCTLEVLVVSFRMKRMTMRTTTW